MPTRNLADAHPHLAESFQAVAIEFSMVCPGFVVKPIEVFRSPEEQMLAFHAGKSNFDGISKKSKHNEIPSRAIDAGVFDAKGRYLTGDTPEEEVFYTVFGLLAEKHGCVWGGRWKKPHDPDHIEI